VLSYLLWQIPGWLAVAALAMVVQGIATVPWWAVSLFVGAWIAKDLLMYRVLRPALRPPRSPTHVGAQGETLEGLSPSGYVRVGGELWRAEARDGRTIAAGVPVVVRGARGLLLLVEEA
jgi:membrane protein implicated in regulation of membrane protease activity